MLTEKIQVHRHIGHNCCEGYLFVKNGVIYFEPASFNWESLGFKILINELSSIRIYDIFQAQSYFKENLVSKALCLKTKENTEYVISYYEIIKLLNMFRLLTTKYNNEPLIN